jgi:hypothetical protein
VRDSPVILQKVIIWPNRLRHRSPFYFAEDSRNLAKDVCAYLFEAMGRICTTEFREEAKSAAKKMKDVQALFSDTFAKDPEFNTLTHRLGPKMIRVVFAAFDQFKDFLSKGEEIGFVQGSAAMRSMPVHSRIASLADSSDYKSYFNGRRAAMKGVIKALKANPTNPSIKFAGSSGGKRKKEEEVEDVDKPPVLPPVTPNQSILQLSGEGKLSFKKGNPMKRKAGATSSATKAKKPKRSSEREKSIIDSWNPDESANSAIILDDDSSEPDLDEQSTEDNMSSVSQRDDKLSSPSEAASSAKVEAVSLETRLLEEKLRQAKLKRQIADEERKERREARKEAEDDLVISELARAGSASKYIQRKDESLVILDDDDEADEELKKQGYIIAARARVKIEGEKPRPEDFEPVLKVIPVDPDAMKTEPKDGEISQKETEKADDPSAAQKETGKADDPSAQKEMDPSGDPSAAQNETGKADDPSAAQKKTSEAEKETSDEGEEKEDFPGVGVELNVVQTAMTFKEYLLSGAGGGQSVIDIFPQSQ